VRWIDTVATVGARLEPGPPWSWLGWLLLSTIVVALISRTARDDASSDADDAITHRP
jgi:hypothetical protein